MTVDGSLVRNVHPGADGLTGQGISIELFSRAAIDASLALKQSVVEDVTDVGVMLRNVENASIDRTTIRNVTGRLVGASSCRESGFGVLAIADPSDDADAGYRYPSRLDITDSIVTGARLEGIQVQGVTATMARALVVGSQTSERQQCLPSLGGDAIAVLSNDSLATDLTVTQSRIEHTERAALLSFGNRGNVTVEGAALECDAFGLVSDQGASPIHLAKAKAIVCSCEGKGRVCGPETHDFSPPLVGTP